MSSMAWDAYEAGITPEFGGLPDDSFYRVNRSYREKETGAFSTFEEAKKWAMENPGKSFTRAPNGNGFIVKK